MASKVYFMDDRASRLAESAPFKAVKLLRDAGIKDLFKPGDTVGIKIHTGEYGNSLNLRPQWIKSIADEVKRLGGYPVLVESNVNTTTCGFGREDTRVHKRIASAHGYNEQTLEIPIRLPDGCIDVEGIRCEVPNGVMLNHTYLASNMADLDAVIVVSHFKGHGMGVFGGAIKNVGIGMVSNKGKTTTHLMNHPKFGLKTAKVNQEGAQQLMQFPHPNPVDMLVKHCAFDALEIVDGELVKHDDRCTACGSCMMQGLYSGVFNRTPDDVLSVTGATIADSASAVVNHIGKDKFMYVNYAFDITPHCDCMDFHDRPMMSNVGIFVSKDPVAVDMACLEASEALVATPGSLADELGFGEPNTERFTNVCIPTRTSQWLQINAGCLNGLGTSEYVLIESEPLEDAEVKAWLVPFHNGNPVGWVLRDKIRSSNYDTDGITALDEPRVPMDELYKKPVGKVAEYMISELTDEI